VAPVWEDWTVLRLRVAWREVGHPNWPVAVLLVCLLLGDEAAHVFEVPGSGWLIAGVLAVCGLALVAVRRPVSAGVAIAAVLLCWSVVLRLAGVEVGGVVGTLLVCEIGSVVVAVCAVVRRSGAGVAASVAGLLIAGCAGALLLRPRHVVPDGFTTATVADIPVAALLLAVCVIIGRHLRAQDGRQARAMHAEVVAAQQRERLSLARELHDVVAHHVGVMVVQAQAAQAVAGTRPEVAAEVLPAIETSGVDALTAMRRLVAALRDDQDGAEPARQLARTTDLAADLRAVAVTPHGGGAPIRLDVLLAVPVPQEITASVLRLVQESVTNARRYAAGAREIFVSVRAEHDSVRIQVRDDGHTAGMTTAKGGGYGLIGMEERVQLLGGQFSAGRAPDGGWQVSATIPLREPRR
jgi:signal transduction histidine kinase